MMKMRKSLWIIHTILLALIGAPNAHADSVEQWTLSGVTFSDGGTANGTFDFDTTTESFSNVALTLNNVIDNGNVYNFNTSGFVSVNPTFTQVCFETSPMEAALFCIGSLVPFSAVEPANSLETGGATEFNMVFSVSGDLSSVAVSPEPGTSGLLIIGLGLVLVIRKRVSQGFHPAT